ncbi:uncharacterized protein LOC111390631 [Olea europaea var. sylvestris]|uniref:uncharacterized protein LOC111390631 n=1 Tax=Olea europaea var. sylvestris TaxID=158386 RepID=UPI000C1D2EEB|nr:uncharacterized protein LOC111390631 [Olea europaea var. sylvestris]
MGGLSKLSRVLTIIFLISVVTLFAELFYVLWRRRVFRRRNPQASTAVDGGGDQPSHYSSSDSSFLSIASSKEFLYAFCIRSHSHSRVEPNSTTPTSSNGESQMEEIDSDIVKLQLMHGPSRFLFTIKEEEREELEAVAENNNNKEKVSLQECFTVAEESPEIRVEIDDHGGCDATPFTTPCASPLYFTPSCSPVHEIDSPL